MDKEEKKEDVKDVFVKNVKKGRIVKVAVWVALSPVLLFVFLSVLIYIPSVQQFAADRVAEHLSQELGMKVKVGRLQLKFPLDLSVEHATALQGNDTVFSADMLDVSVRMMPLFRSQIEVDGIFMSGLKVNTMSLIDACTIKGKVGEFALDAHNIDLKNGMAVVNKAVLKNTVLDVAMSDSVAEDTTASEPALWKVQLCNLHLHNVDLRLHLAPAVDSVSVGVGVGNAKIVAFLDLGEEIYRIDEFDMNNSSVNYDVGRNPYLCDSLQERVASFDASHIALTDFAMKLDSVEYRGTGSLNANIRQLTARERCGLKLEKTEGRVMMEDSALVVPSLALTTDDSYLTAGMKMDMNAFDDKNPGVMDVHASAQIGKNDMLLFVPNVATELVRNWPVKPMSVVFDAHGNMKSMHVDRLNAKLEDAFDLTSSADFTDITDSLRMGAAVNLKVLIHNADFIKGFVPADVAEQFVLPRNMTLLADAGMNDGKVSVDADLSTPYGSLILTSDYDVAKEGYLIGLDIENFMLSSFMKMEQQAYVNGSVTVNGRGTDIYSRKTCAEAIVALDEAHFGSVDVSGSRADAALSDGCMSLGFICDNSLLNTSFNLKGHLYPNKVDGTLDIDLPFADIRALGFAKERLEVTTKGVVAFTSDFSNKFMVDSHIDGLDMIIGKDSVKTEHFDIHAESTSDSTLAVVRTGDLDFNFRSPYNLFSLVAKSERFAKMVTKQMDKRTIDLEHLKKYMPVASLETSVGRNNPVTKILATNGISFDEVKASLITSPESGLLGNAHMYGFTNDTIDVDTVYFNLSQDSTSILFETGVICDDQKLCPGFKAYLDGHVDLDDADVHLAYFSKKGKKGIDLGIAAEFTDSLLCLKLYPDQPVIAFSQFSLNKDNYVNLNKKGDFFADVRLTSLKDSCRIALEASVVEKQYARVLLEKLNIEDLLTVLPFMPKITGMLNVDATYRATEENFLVNGWLSADKFSYEKMLIGDVKADFDYAPQGTTAHVITAKLSHNEQEVITLDGIYDSDVGGSLDGNLVFNDLPLSIASPFVPDQIAYFNGFLGGQIHAVGPVDKLVFDGQLMPDGMTVQSDMYAVKLRFADEPILIADSRLTFNKYKVYAVGENPLTLNGYVDLANMEQIRLSLGLYGRNFQLVDAQRTRKAVLFGKVYGDFFTRVTGTTDDLSVRGVINVLGNTNMTYIMADTPLSVDNRLDDIVTFVDFTAPPESADDIPKKTFMGIDMQVQLVVEDGAQFHCEFSADRQSYVNIQGGGSLAMNYTPEGILTLQGRYTVNEGEMKYSLPVIPLKTFTIRKGSYIEFTGDPMNPVLKIEAYEQTKAAVNENGGGSRTVAFDVGLKITNTLENMGLDFTIDAPEDITVQNELAGMSKEEKNKLAVAMLATGMYLSGNNSSGFSASNALNNFLQSEINSIAGQALRTAVDVNVGMEQNTNYDGSTRTDYSFKFSKRFFSNRLNVVIGGKVCDDNSSVERESGTYIDDVSLEWRLDKGGTRYVRIFHEKNYDNLLEGELIENGAGIVLRKKMDKLSELFIFKSDKKRREEELRRRQAGGSASSGTGNVSGGNGSSGENGSSENSVPVDKAQNREALKTDDK